MTDLAYVKFVPGPEKWNTYKLEDGSILRAKMVLVSVMREKIPGKPKEMGLLFNNRTIVGVEAPKKNFGKPDEKTYSVDELAASIRKDDLEFKVLKEGWNTYKLPSLGLSLSFKLALIKVSRTWKHNNFGEPIYIVSTQPLPKVKSKKKKRKKK